MYALLGRKTLSKKPFNIAGITPHQTGKMIKMESVSASISRYLSLKNNTSAE